MLTSAQELSTKSIALPNFTSVSFETVGDLLIEHDNKHRLTIEAEPKVLAVIVAKVEGGRLRIFANGDFKTDKPVNFKLHLPKLNAVELQSSGDIQLGSCETDNLDFLVSGSGSIYATSVKAKKIKIRLDGAGDIELAGSAANLDAGADGAGTINADKLIASSAIATIDGSGDIRLRVLNTLKATVNGSGTISYRGNPKLTSSINGAGEIIKQE